MGASAIQTNDELDKKTLLSTTELLFKWISKMRMKKIQYLRSRRRNIRVEAVLGHALRRAEHELRNKHIARIDRWQELKLQSQAKNEIKKEKKKHKKTRRKRNKSRHNKVFGDDIDDNATCQYEMMVKQKSDENENCDKSNWNSEVWPELDSLDKFMSEIGEIKTPLQR